MLLHLFIYSFLSVSTDGYLILLNFVAEIVSLWPFELFSAGFCVPLIYPNHMVFFSQNFFTFYTTRYSRLILHIFCSSHFSKEVPFKEVPFIGVWDYKPEFGHQMCSLLLGMLFLRSLS